MSFTVNESGHCCDCVCLPSSGEQRIKYFTNVGVEGCDQHQGLVHQLVDPLCVGLDAHHTVSSEGHRGIAQQLGRVEHILNLGEEAQREQKFNRTAMNKESKPFHTK